MAEKVLLFFYEKEDVDTGNLSIPLCGRYRFEHWCPTWFDIFPKGCFGKIYFLIYYIYFFLYKKDAGYSIWLVYDNELLIHHSVIFPCHFRFPFMRKQDRQIGMIYTSPLYRNKGIADSVLQLILRDSNFGYWYIVDEQNTFSIKLATKNGFRFNDFAIKTLPDISRFELFSVYKKYKS